MKSYDFDLITVGGGLGGSALAKNMAEIGVRVLVLEREHQFSDRVRGEWLAPWGVAEGHNESGFTTRYLNAALMNCRTSTLWVWDRHAI